MPLEDRLRDGFERSARVVDPDLEERLSDVGAKYRHRRRIRRSGQVASLVALVVFVAVIGPRVLDGLRSPSGGRPGGPPGPSPSAGAFEAIAGTYTMRLPDAPGVVRDNGMAGSWTLRLRPDGTMFLSAPASFPGSTSAISFELSGAAEFRTAAFANDLCATQPAGRYTWRRSPMELAFRVVDEPCEARAALFATRSWRSAGAGS
jgi:hypothetical protein